MRRNMLLNTDSYKPSHWLQFPRTPRGSTTTWSPAAGGTTAPCSSGSSSS